jgi:hypothetical protein
VLQKPEGFKASRSMTAGFSKRAKGAAESIKSKPLATRLEDPSKSGNLESSGFRQ